MKSKKLLSWMLALAMLLTMLPATILAQGTVQSIYGFEISAPDKVTVGEEVDANVTLKATNVQDLGYDKVRINVKVTPAELKTSAHLVATEGANKFDVAQIGYYGPETGFALTKDWNKTTALKCKFDKAGSYTITYELTDLTTNAVLATKTTIVTAELPRSTYAFETAAPDKAVVGESVAASVTLKAIAVKDLGYDKARINVTVIPEDLKTSAHLVVTDGTNSFDIAQIGYYGLEAGFALAKDWNQTTALRCTFDKAGTYTIRYDLVDLTNNKVLATKTQSVVVSAKPEPSVYGFEATAPDSVVVGAEVDASVTLQSTAIKDTGYDKVRVNVKVEPAELKAAAHLNAIVGEDKFDVAQIGYFGPEAGFAITKGWHETTNLTCSFDQVGTYTITYELVDLADNNKVLASKSHTITVTPAPQPSIYGIETTLPENAVASVAGEAALDVKASEIKDFGYEKARVNVEVTPAEQKDAAHLTVTEGETVKDAVALGYFGDENGAVLAKDGTISIPFAYKFDQEGAYTITFHLVDLATGNVIATKQATVTVAASHAVVVEEQENGTVKVDKPLAAAGETVTLTIEPKTGYTVKTVTYNDTVIEPKDGVYRFVMPEGAVKITVEYEAAKGGIAQDPGKTGGADMTAVVSGQTITFGGAIDYYEKDDTLGREAGNYAGVQVTAPEGITPDGSAKLTVNGKEIASGDFFDNQEGEGAYFWYYLLIEKIGEEDAISTLDVQWNADTVEHYQIIVSKETKLVHPITLSKDAGGTAVIDKTKAKAGDTVTVEAAPSRNYTIDEVSYNGKTISGSKGVYTFEMPDEAVKVRVDFSLDIEYGNSTSQLAKRTRDILSFEFKDVEGSSVGIDQIERTITASVPKGTDVTNLKPTIKINGESVSPKSGVAQDFSKPVKYTVTADNRTTKTYTVKVVEYDPGTTVTPSPPTTVSIFADMPASHWAYSYAKDLVNKGIISGDGNNGRGIIVRPGDAITREEASKISILAAGIPVISATGLTFTDYWKVSDWAKPYVEAGVRNNVLSGYPEGDFRPDWNVSREEFTKMMMTAFDIEPLDNVSLSFTDANQITWSKGYIASAVKLGIINGYEDGSFQPHSSITRAEAFKMISLCIQLMED